MGKTSGGIRSKTTGKGLVKTGKPSATGTGIPKGYGGAKESTFVKGKTTVLPDKNGVARFTEYKDQNGYVATIITRKGRPRRMMLEAKKGTVLDSVITVKNAEALKIASDLVKKYNFNKVSLKNSKQHPKAYEYYMDAKYKL